jgi:hypothetical protein
MKSILIILINPVLASQKTHWVPITKKLFSLFREIIAVYSRNNDGQSRFLFGSRSVKKLSGNTGYLDWYFSWFYSVPSDKCRDRISIRRGQVLAVSLWPCSPCEPWPLFQFLNLYTVGKTPWTGGQPPPTNRKTQTQNKRTQIFMPWVGFEPTILVFEQAKTVLALDRVATKQVRYI